MNAQHPKLIKALNRYGDDRLPNIFKAWKTFEEQLVGQFVQFKGQQHSFMKVTAVEVCGTPYFDRGDLYLIFDKDYRCRVPKNGRKPSINDLEINYRSSDVVASHIIQPNSYAAQEVLFEKRGRVAASNLSKKQITYERWWLGEYVKCEGMVEYKKVMKIELVGSKSFIKGSVYLTFLGGEIFKIKTESWIPRKKDVLIK